MKSLRRRQNGRRINMKSFKPILFSLLVIILVVLVVENIEFFTDTYSLRIDLVFLDYQTPPIHLSIYFLGFFLIGLLLSYIYGLSERIKGKKIIKSQKEMITKLEEELNLIRGSSGTDNKRDTLPENN
nr:DUF1049 domain-containing protein [Desulfobacterales bacterium]